MLLLDWLVSGMVPGFPKASFGVFSTGSLFYIFRLVREMLKSHFRWSDILKN